MTNKTILVVDDNLVSRMLPGYFIKQLKHDYVIIECETGGQAVTAVSRHHVGFVLLDISMPIMNGVDTAKLIRKASAFRDVKIIAYTADISIVKEDGMGEVVFDEVLVKPISREALFAILYIKQ